VPGYSYNGNVEQVTLTPKVYATGINLTSVQLNMYQATTLCQLQGGQSVVGETGPRAIIVV
jgi:hypothetical protein